MSGDEAQPLTRRELRERRLAAEAARGRGSALPEAAVTTADAPAEAKPAVPTAAAAKDVTEPPAIFAPEEIRENSEAAAEPGPVTRRQRRIDAAKAKAAGVEAKTEGPADVDTSHVDLSKLKQESPVTDHFAKIREKSAGDEGFVPANDEDVHDADPQAEPDQAQKDLFNTGLNSPETRSVNLVMPQPAPAQRNFASEDDGTPDEEFGASKARFESRAQVRERQSKQGRNDFTQPQSARERLAASNPDKSKAGSRNGTPEPFRASGAQGLEPLGFMDGGGARARRQFVLSVGALSVGVLTFIVGLIMMLTR